MKKLLFIHINFYNYNRYIISKFKSNGYQVLSFSQDFKITFPFRFLFKLFPRFLIFIDSLRQNHFIRYITKSSIIFDHIFIIKGDKLQQFFFDKLKSLYPDAKFTLYLWDDVDRISNFKNISKNFDRIFTFDKNDSVKYNLIFLPLFFCEEFLYKSVKKSIDVYSSGWLHSDRHEIFSYISYLFKMQNIVFFFHLYTSFFRSIKYISFNLSSQKSKFIITNKKISFLKNINLMQMSKAVLDIPHKTQSGLTLRTFEALASNCKLITTNASVKEYDFYNPINILVIDPKKPLIDKEFLNSKFVEVPHSILNNYSLNSWINKIFYENIN